MTWVPWILLAALLALGAWCSAELARCLTWARRALLRGEPARPPDGWLVRRLGLAQLLRAVETRASGEGEIRAAAARRTTSVTSSAGSRSGAGPAGARAAITALLLGQCTCTPTPLHLRTQYPATDGENKAEKTNKFIL
jgi:hypothetical protein